MKAQKGWIAVTNKEQLNAFFVSCFNSILRAEESALETITNGKLTIKEIHFIEAVFLSQKVGENCLSTIAAMLGVTVGTLATSFARLEQKGYLYKEQDKEDRRIYYIVPTRLAEMIYAEHNKFHEKLVNHIAAQLSPDEFKNLVGSLKKLDDFFQDHTLKKLQDKNAKL